MNSKTKKPSILPVLLIAAVTGLLTLVFLNSLKNDTAVVVAKRAIGVGARVTEVDLEIKRVRAQDALPNVATKIEDVAGEVVSAQRLPGDQITLDMLGSQAVSAIAAGLAPDHRAVAVKVTRSSGLAGILRPGDYVTLIAVIEPPSRQADEALAPGAPAAVTTTVSLKGTATPTAPGQFHGIVPQTFFARVTANGLKVLLVPQTFRYEEVTTSDSQGFSTAQTSQVGQSDSVIVLDVPVTPVSLTGPDGPLTLSLPELIALLDANAKVYLVLEPASGAAAANFPGIAIEQLVNQGVGAP